MPQLVQLPRNDSDGALVRPQSELCEMGMVESESIRLLAQMQVLETHAHYAAGGVSQDTLASRYGVKQSAISRIIRGVRWTPPQGELKDV